jgi:acyl dehydratase
MGLRWADLTVGRTFTTTTRTVTEADVVGFATLTGDFSEIHTSEQFAASTPFGRRIAHGLLGLTYSHGAMINPGTFAELAIAFLGISDWRFARPVFIGDTIHTRFEIAELRRSASNPDNGVMTLAVTVHNQDGEVVQQGRQTLLLAVDLVGPHRHEDEGDIDADRV